MAVHHVFHTGTFLLFVATVLLLFTSIGPPVISNDGFLKVTDGDHAVTFGALGYCETTPSGKTCSSAHVGYDIAAVVGSTIGIQYSSTPLYNLTRGLVLHPVLTGLSFFALLIAFGASCCGFIIASAIAAFSWMLTLAVLVIDFSLFGAVKNHVHDNSTATANFSIAIWLMLAAFLVLFFASIFTCFACFSDRRSTRKTRGSRW